MKKVVILTDSTANIPTSIMQQYDIFTVPLGLIWGNNTYEDGISMTPNEFYERLRIEKTLPTTSQPSVGKIRVMLQSLIDQDYAVLGIFLSSKLSGTYQSALQARALLPAEDEITIVDSEATTLAMGFQVVMAARAAKDGASMAQCEEIVKQTRENSGVYFMVDNLEFLHRGGRIGGAQRFLGTALGTKPILYLRNGKIEPLERVRTKTKALDRMVELVKEQCKGKSPIRLASVQANSASDANLILVKAMQQMEVIETMTADLSPVIGIHAGPGTVALAFMTGR